MATYNTLPDYSGITGPMSQNYGANNALQTGLYGQAAGSLSKPLDFSGLPSMPTADQTGRDQMTDAVYGQQTRFLDPQFAQQQSDLTSRLANQGIMMGSDAYNREMNNFNLQRTAAYGDARDRAIQQGGAEQTRMFDMGLQGRKEGINELLAQRNAPLEALQSLNGINTATTNGLFGAVNSLYSAGIGNQNANLASQSNFNNGLFSLGSAALQNPQAVKDGYNWLSGLYSQYAS
jgi:hypothetical protein